MARKKARALLSRRQAVGRIAFVATAGAPWPWTGFRADAGSPGNASSPICSSTTALLSGRRFAPGSLMAIPKTASLLAAVPAPRALNGLRVSIEEEKSVRKAIDATGNKAAEAALESVNQALSSFESGDGQ